jgi:hypothetical protein
MPCAEGHWRHKFTQRTQAERHNCAREWTLTCSLKRTRNKHPNHDSNNNLKSKQVVGPWWWWPGVSPKSHSS